MGICAGSDNKASRGLERVFDATSLRGASSPWKFGFHWGISGSILLSSSSSWEPGFFFCGGSSSSRVRPFLSQTSKGKAGSKSSSSSASLSWGWHHTIPNCQSKRKIWTIVIYLDSLPFQTRSNNEFQGLIAFISPLQCVLNWGKKLRCITKVSEFKRRFEELKSVYWGQMLVEY